MLFVYIASGLALLAACTSLYVACKNEKRSKKRNTAMLRYVEATADKACEKAVTISKDSIRDNFAKLSASIDDVKRVCDDLANGILPDYEQAKAAANAVNDFSRGISNILGFDPMQALAEQREKDKGGGGE